GLFLEGQELLAREERQPDVDLGRELGPEPAGGPLGAPAAPVHHEDAPHASAGEVVGDGPAHHAATDDEDVPAHQAHGFGSKPPPGRGRNACTPRQCLLYVRAALQDAAPAPAGVRTEKAREPSCPFSAATESPSRVQSARTSASPMPWWEPAGRAGSRRTNRWKTRSTSPGGSCGPLSATRSHSPCSGSLRAFTQPPASL